MSPTPVMLSMTVILLLVTPMPASAVETNRAEHYHGVFRELPITAITPRGWLAELLRRQRDGLALHRNATGFPFDTNLWVGKIPNAHWPSYEQTAYFVDGAYRCGLLLHDDALIKVGTENVEYVLTHPQPDGKLGPTAQDMQMAVADDGVAGPQGVASQWPFAVFTRALMAHYSATHDQRVLDALTRHYLALPARFGDGLRDVENIEGMCWLYEITGDTRIRDLAEETWQTFSASKANARQQWTLENLTSSGPLKGHGVTVCETTKQPALLYLATGNQMYLDAALGGFDRLYRDHEQVNGVLSSDSGTSGKAPDHQNETCVITDYTWSLGYLMMASGQARWGDTIERAILNAGLGVIDRDFKSHQYYGSPNQMVATQTSNHPTTGVPNRKLQAYCPIHQPECCTGNVQRMIPTYVSRLWLSDGSGGVVAAMYAPCTLHTTAGAAAAPVTIAETTDYPFDGVVRLKISTEKPVEFALQLRVPGWADGAKASVNGKDCDEVLQPRSFFKIQREFLDGDEIRLSLPMSVRVEKPVENGVSLLRGPLVYALKIKTQRTIATKIPVKDAALPAWDEVAVSDWNYALAINGEDDAGNAKVDARGLGDRYPWTVESTPVTLTAPARQVPAWQLTSKDENPALPEPPFAQAQQITQVELVPYGATQLRVSVFPIASP